MKTKLSLLFSALLISAALNGQSSGSCVVEAILSGYSPRNFTTVPVTEQQLDLILKCGIKAPSARNNQPWRFTVIRDTSSMKEIINNVLPGNVLVVVSGAESTQTSVSADFDCALATHSMFVAAEGLGLGARIYGSPVSTVNSKRDAFQIPAGFKPVIVLRIGNIDKTVDAVSAATTRKKPEEIVNYKK
jgi:nitroreductase